MNQKSRAFAMAAPLLAARRGRAGICPKAGRHPQDVHLDSPASMSIHEEATVVAERPMMGVFNNLVMFDQHVHAEQPRNRSCPIWPPAGRGTRTGPS